MVQYHFIVYGHVQGVFFRVSTKREADRLGVVGWVKNKQDGSVEVLCQGTQKEITIFFNYCKHGPEEALVSCVEMLETSFQDAYEGFKIVE